MAMTTKISLHTFENLGLSSIEGSARFKRNAFNSLDLVILDEDGYRTTEVVLFFEDPTQATKFAASLLEAANKELARYNAEEE